MFGISTHRERARDLAEAPLVQLVFHSHVVPAASILQGFGVVVSQCLWYVCFTLQKAY